MLKCSKEVRGAAELSAYCISHCTQSFNRLLELLIGAALNVHFLSLLTAADIS